MNPITEIFGSISSIFNPPIYGWGDIILPFFWMVIFSFVATWIITLILSIFWKEDTKKGTHLGIETVTKLCWSYSLTLLGLLVILYMIALLKKGTFVSQNFAFLHALPYLLVSLSTLCIGWMESR